MRSDKHDKWQWFPFIGIQLTDESGKALMIASLLGIIIDTALKEGLVRDAVSMSLGYLLPPRMR